jgi:hypothetical protein
MSSKYNRVHDQGYHVQSYGYVMPKVSGIKLLEVEENNMYVSARS